MADKRTQQKRQYSNPTQRAATHSSGSGATMIARPDGMEFMSTKEAKVYKADVIPYVVKRGSEKPGGNPYAATGSIHYERTFWAHYGFGPGNKVVVCPAMTWGKACPACEERGELERQRSQDKELKARIYDLRPKERQLFYVYDRTSPAEEAKGVKLWEIAYFNFGKLLDTRIKTAVEENREQFECFHSLEEGSRLLITMEEKQMGGGRGGSYIGASIIDFIKRKASLPDSLLDDLAPLDDLLIEIPYKKLKNMYEGIEDEEEEEVPPVRTGTSRSSRPVAEDEDEPAPTTRKKPPVEEPEDDEPEVAKPPVTKPKGTGKPKPEPVEEEPEDDDDKTAYKVGDKVIYDEEECEVTKVSPDGTSLTLKDADGTLHKAIDPIEVELAPPPKPKGGKPKPRPADDEDE